MVSWNQFALRRRINLQKFISSLQNTDRDTLSRRLVELQINPSSFPWHELELPLEAATADPVPVEAPAADPPTAEPPAEPEASDG